MNIAKAILAFGLSAACYSFATQYEAEDATLSGTAELASSDKASGGKFVSQKEGDITFKVTAEKEGKHLLKVHYKSGGFKANYIVVNGGASTQMDFLESASFTDEALVITLKAGENTIAIKKYWGWIDVDYIDVAEYVSKEITLCNKLVTPEPTESATKLYNFLVNNFGKKTISGIMTGSMENYKEGNDFKTHEDVTNIFTRSGKYPALVGVDFLFATGPNAADSWYKDYTNKGISLAKDLWKQGGIPAFTWHWKDPADSVDTFYASENAAKNASQTEWTTFDFTTAFMTGTTTWDTLSAAYKGIIDDIDYIADFFLDLQKDSVAAIFRPLHEAGGDWFWWSTKTGPQYAALYRLVYERMVFVKGVKNLVWVFNPSTNDTSWNPGEDYYDVISTDIYNDDNDHSSNSSAFENFKIKWTTSKILALSENGPIPDISNMQADNAMWSWWMPWYGTWGGKYPGQTSNDVWKSNMESESIITIDDMPGWDKYTEANSASGTCKEASQNTEFNGDADKASGEKKEDKMLVKFTTIGDDGILLSYSKLPELIGSKTISVEITVDGSGATANGVWIGLALTRDGSKDSVWTWEQSPSDGCWLEQKSGPTTCKFNIENYTYKDADGNAAEAPTDLDNIFSVTLVVSAPGFAGSIIFDNMVTDNNQVISLFDDTKGLFDTDKDGAKIATISLLSSNSDTTIVADTKDDAGEQAPGNFVQTRVTQKASLGIVSETLLLTTATAGNVRIDVFGMNGKRIGSLYNGALAAGSHSFSMAAYAKGQYIVRVKGAGMAASQPVLLK